MEEACNISNYVCVMKVELYIHVYYMTACSYTQMLYRLIVTFVTQLCYAACIITQCCSILSDCAKFL